jgi:hypothetical protein
VMRRMPGVEGDFAKHNSGVALPKAKFEATAQATRVVLSQEMVHASPHQRQLR